MSGFKQGGSDHGYGDLTVTNGLQVPNPLGFINLPLVWILSVATFDVLTSPSTLGSLPTRSLSRPLVLVFCLLLSSFQDWLHPPLSVFIFSFSGAGDQTQSPPHATP
jgi:hypothetical protein